MGYTRIYVHLVWTTKKRKKLLRKDIRAKVFDHIKSNAKTKGIYIDQINGYTDHVHCLVGINGEQQISKIVQLLKGESAYWINRTNITNEKFKWQQEYYAVSVGIMNLNIVRNYIRNQEQHHQRKSLENELYHFNKLYKFNGLKP